MDIGNISERVGAAREQLINGQQKAESAEERRERLAAVIGQLLETLRGFSSVDLKTEAEALGVDLEGAGENFLQGREILVEAVRGSDNPLVLAAIYKAGSARNVITGKDAGATAEIPILVEQMDGFASAVDVLLMAAQGVETTLVVLAPAIERGQDLAQEANHAARTYLEENLGAG